MISPVSAFNKEVMITSFIYQKNSLKRLVLGNITYLGQDTVGNNILLDNHQHGDVTRKYFLKVSFTSCLYSLRLTNK